MAIIDVFTFNGEYDLLEIRLNVLNDYVDQFVIIEAPTTFSGKPKPLYYELQKDRYSQFHDKIKYFVIDEFYTKEEIAQANSSPNTQGASHWKHEFLQKESIKKALTHLNDDDTVFIGDVDEIWDTKEHYAMFPMKLKLKVYTYYLNNRSTEEFWGTYVNKAKYILGQCLNHLRTNGDCKTVGTYGWHFTSIGGYEEVKRKLTDSYTTETYADERVMNNLKDAVFNSTDFLGRGFSYHIDTSDWPIWLKENKDKYKHLMRGKGIWRN